VLEEIQKEWQKDSVINKLDIRGELIKIPLLHSKYLDMLILAKTRLRKAETRLIELSRLKFSYYRGELTREELQENGWTQYQGVKPIKADMDRLIETDSDIILAQDKHQYYKICVDSIETIMRSLQSRGYDMKTFASLEQFYAGG
jgi:hypothetical protein